MKAIYVPSYGSFELPHSVENLFGSLSSPSYLSPQSFMQRIRRAPAGPLRDACSFSQEFSRAVEWAAHKFHYQLNLAEPEEGGPCPLCGEDLYVEQPTNCSCHMGHAPCSACTSVKLYCGDAECGWDQDDEVPVFKRIGKKMRPSKEEQPTPYIPTTQAKELFADFAKVEGRTATEIVARNSLHEENMQAFGMKPTQPTTEGDTIAKALDITQLNTFMSPTGWFAPNVQNLNTTEENKS